MKIWRKLLGKKKIIFLLLSGLGPDSIDEESDSDEDEGEYEEEISRNSFEKDTNVLRVASESPKTSNEINVEIVKQIVPLMEEEEEGEEEDVDPKRATTYGIALVSDLEIIPPFYPEEYEREEMYQKKSVTRPKRASPVPTVDTGPTTLSRKDSFRKRLKKKAPSVPKPKIPPKKVEMQIRNDATVDIPSLPPPPPSRKPPRRPSSNVDVNTTEKKRETVKIIQPKLFEIFHKIQPFRKLEISTILKITCEFYQYSIGTFSTPSIIDFYGKFKLDKYQEVFVIFKSFLIKRWITSSKNVEPITKFLNILPLKSVETLEMRQKISSSEILSKVEKSPYRAIPTSLIKHCENLNSLEYFFVEKNHFFDNLTLTNLRKINFSVNLMNDKILQMINRMTEMRDLTIHSETVARDCENDLKLTKLINLAVKCLPFSVKFHHNFANLQIINFSHSRILKVQIKGIVENCSNLKGIRFNICEIDNVDEDLTKMFSLPKIQVVGFSKCTITGEKNFLDKVVYNSSLGSKLEQVVLREINSRIPSSFFGKFLMLCGSLKSVTMELNDGILSAIFETENFWRKKIIIEHVGNKTLDIKLLESIKKKRKIFIKYLNRRNRGWRRKRPRRKRPLPPIIMKRMKYNSGNMQNISFLYV